MLKSADNLNSARDYIMNPIEESFEFSLDEGRYLVSTQCKQQGKSRRLLKLYEVM